MIAHPPVLGWWEGSTVFHTFAPEDIWPNTQIHPRASIGGYEYASLDFSRYVAKIFGFNLFSIRLLPIIYGLISLIFMYCILVRWHGKLVALIVTALLATNQTFLTFQHQLNISIVTFTSLLFCIERFQIVDLDSVRRRSALLFGLACAFVALHYQIGRYCMLGIVFFWLTRGLEFKKHFRPAFGQLWLLDRNKRKYFLIAALGFIIALELLHPMNLFYFLNKRFLSPPNAEYAQSITEALSYIRVNMPLIMHSLLGTNSFYGNHSSDLIISIPYRLLNIPLVILTLLGVVAMLSGFINKRHSAFVFLLLFMSTVLLSLSQLIPSGVWITTLSPYRMFYALIPLCFLVAAGLDWIFSKVIKENQIARLLVTILLLALISFQTVQYLNETNSFRDFIGKIECQFEQSPSDNEVRKYSCKYVSKSSQDQTFNHPEFNYYYKDILPYWSYAGKLSKKIGQFNVSGNTVLIVEAPVRDFEAKPFQSHYAKKNFHQMFLALYLAEQGVHVNYLVPYKGERPLSRMESLEYALWNRVPRPTRQFPLNLDQESGKYVYKGSPPTHPMVKLRYFLSAKLLGMDYRELRRIIPGGFPLSFVEQQREKDVGFDPRFCHFSVRSTSPRKSNIYLVTTDEEKSEVLKRIKENGTEYITVKL